MKRHSLWALTACLLTACGGGASRDGSPLEFENVVADKTVAIENENGAPQCSVHLELAEANVSQGERAKAINAAIITSVTDFEELSMQQAADSFANTYTRNYIKNFQPLYREDKGDENKRAWYNYHYNVTTETGKGRDGVLVYSIVTDYYEGGAHGLNMQQVLNFDTESGQVITLDDIFVAGYERPLSDMLLQKLMEQTNSRNLDELHEKGYLYSMEMYPSTNFVLGEDGVTFVYNAYEIAPYAMGRTELTLGYDKLSAILKQQ